MRKTKKVGCEKRNVHNTMIVPKTLHKFERKHFYCLLMFLKRNHTVYKYFIHHSRNI
jgi:hypothetical protein